MNYNQLCVSGEQMKNVFPTTNKQNVMLTLTFFLINKRLKLHN